MSKIYVYKIIESFVIREINFNKDDIFFFDVDSCTLSFDKVNWSKKLLSELYSINKYREITIQYYRTERLDKLFNR